MRDQVVPGPCASSGCPSPTQIDCVEVTKVYDFCFTSQTRDQVCFDIPHSCGTVPSGSTATGTITAVTCTASSVVPILNSSGAPTGFANVTLLVTATESITILSPSGATVCTFTGMFNFFAGPFVLCAPSGTTITCESPSSAVATAMIINTDVCSVVTICLLIEAVATVKLLVPTYGFCVPVPCVVSPAPPFACPPSPLFPPQCAPVAPTTCPPDGEEFPVEGPVV